MNAMPKMLADGGQKPVKDQMREILEGDDGEDVEAVQSRAAAAA